MTLISNPSGQDELRRTFLTHHVHSHFGCLEPSGVGSCVSTLGITKPDPVDGSIVQIHDSLCDYDSFYSVDRAKESVSMFWIIEFNQRQPRTLPPGSSPSFQGYYSFKRCLFLYFHLTKWYHIVPPFCLPLSPKSLKSRGQSVLPRISSDF